MSPRRVAVIGAGPAGLVAAAHSVREGHHVCVYEQSCSVGGIWVFSEDPKHHSAMYENMKTNLPKEMMMYNGVPFPDEHPSFMNSQQVLLHPLSHNKPPGPGAGLPYKILGGAAHPIQHKSGPCLKKRREVAREDGASGGNQGGPF